MSRCTVTETWTEIPPHGVRLHCAFPAGHAGEHGAADVEYLPDPGTPSPSTSTPATGQAEEEA